MEDENGLELSLGLGCGGSSAKSKDKDSGPSDIRTEEGDRGNKLVDDFKNFLHGGTQKPDSSTGSQINDSVKPHENFLNGLSGTNSDADGDASINLSNKGLWVSSSNRPVEVEDEKKLETGNKRKILFNDMNNHKKHERDANLSDLHDKKTSHISIIENGSTPVNEDIGESEVEGSIGSKRFTGAGVSSEVQKEAHRFFASRPADLQGQKRPNGSSESEVKHGNLNYGVPFSIEPSNVMNVPYPFPARESNFNGAPGTSGHPLPGTQSVNTGNLPVLFGYSPVQLPTLDKDYSWGSVSHLQQFHSSYAGRGPSNSDKQNDGVKIAPAMQVISCNASEATLYDERTRERIKGDGKQHITEESSSHTEDDVKGSSMNLRAKDASGSSSAPPEGCSLDFSAIKPGIAPGVKFGGCGSFPNLPWVSSTGSGTNGRTISGVPYKYSANQIRIVCACHGSHMSPEEFVRHANGEDVNPENGSNLASIPSKNPAASAQS